MKLTSRTILLAGSMTVLMMAITSGPIGARSNDDATLKITVRDPNGAAVPGASVTARKKPCRCEDCPLEQRPCRCCVQQVTTNEEGQATLTVSSGSYDLRVDVSGFKSAEQNNVEVSAGATQTVEITLNVGGVQVSGPADRSKKNDESEFVLSGHVENDNKQPLANVEIQFAKKDCRCESCSENDKPCKCCFAQRSMSDASGNFSVSGLKPSDYYIRLMKDGQTAGSFNGLPVRQSEKVLFTVQESKSGGPNF
jgi:protocatechuate 3,4-dioxygenase beta subunit